jgi:hypothetical protein
MNLQEIEPIIAGYMAAWNESDPVARRSLLGEAFEESGTYTDPLSQAANRAELDAVIARFRQDNPGASFSLENKIDFHNHYVRFYWLLSFANGARLSGMDFAEISPEGKISKIVGFF